MMKKDIWRLVITPPAHGAWNMAVDEAVLEEVGRGNSLPTLRLFAWEPPCLSIGYAQPISDVDLVRLHANGWELVRRPTGGRAVLHTDELTYSVIAPVNEPRVVGTLLESYQRLAKALVEALRLLILPVEVQEQVAIPAAQKANPVCFEVPSAYEITFDGKKLVGSAQARRKEGMLQHGSLPLYGDLTRILQVLVYPDEAARIRAAERLLEHATTVETALGRIVTWEEAAQAFTIAFKSVFNLELQPSDLTLAEKIRAEELSIIKYSRPEMTQKQNG
jgi:lipoate-protein ligase A